MDSKRQQKVSRLLQKELGDIFQKDKKSMLGSELVSVTNITVSPDLSVAKIWISIMTTGDRKEAFRKIQSHKSEIRKALGNRIGKQVRKVPELIFYLDEGQDHASRIDKILSDLDIPDADESTE